jgi:hypothetical protein
MYLAYAKVTRVSVRRVLKLSLLTLTGMLTLYVLSYAIAYRQRSPAANLAYWVYPEIPHCSEDMLYRLFYPVYFPHRHLLDCGRHNYDRATIIFPPDFQG